MFAGAPDLRTYWQNIVHKVDAVHAASDSWALPFFDPASSENDRIYTRRGGFLGDQVEFNPIDFGIMPNTVDGGDTDHFLALKLSRLALEDAGYATRKFDSENTGIILGRGTYVNRGYNTLLQHGQMVDQTLGLLGQLRPDLGATELEEIRKALKASLPPFTAEMVPSLVPNVMTGRIANRLNLMGPNYIVDAACASSLIAVELAVKELRSGRCNMVITGGVHTTTPPQLYMMFCLLNALSRRNLRSFDKEADGTLLGEGLGILVLKRLQDAQQDGDRIYAVIKGVGSSSDGKALGLLAPRLEGEVLALRRAYEESGIDPQTIGLIEAHGTGMPVGDRTEVQSLKEVFGERDGALPSRALGSVKSMIGHCIPAAGIAGIIKTTLALYHRVLPPTLCEAVNDKLGIEATSFYVNNATRPWVHGSTVARRRAGVNAFGFGGVNAHAILEEYAEPDEVDRPVLHSEWPSELFVLSAADRDGLLRAVRELQERIAAPHPLPAASLAQELAARPAGGHRLAIVAADGDDLGTKLALAAERLARPEPPRLPARRGVFYGVAGADAAPGRTAFLFPGEGGQHRDMLADLCLYFPQVRAWFDVLDEAFEGLGAEPPSAVVFPPPTCVDEAGNHLIDGQLLSLEVGSAAVFVASLALSELLGQFGVRADVMLGHSTGEGAALVASGTVRLADRAALLDGMRYFNKTYRQLSAEGKIPRGALLTVGAVDRKLLDSLVDSFDGRMFVALDNCPNQTVLFGNAEDVEQAAARFREAGAICMPMPFDRAYHTPLFRNVEGTLRGLYESLDMGPGHTPVYSCATAEVFPAQPAAIRELATRQWFSQVRFRETIERFHDEGVRTFIEVGPGANLTSFVRDTLSGRAHTAIAVNQPGKAGLGQLQHLLAHLWCGGADIDTSALYRHRKLQPLEPVAPVRAGGAGDHMLEMIMPTMTLPASLVGKLRKAPAGQSPVAAPAAASSAQEPRPVPATPVGGAPDGRVSVLHSHFELMQQFLASQSRVLETLAASVQGGASTAGQTAAAAAPVTAAPASGRSFEQDWPLLGRVVTRDSTNLYCEREVDLARDIYLLDHTLGSPLSSRQVELVPLAVIPFTMSMELLAEAARCLTGAGYQVSGLRDVRGYRWLGLDRGSLTLGISAEVREGQGTNAVKVHARVFQLEPAGENARRHLVFEGDIQLSVAFPAPPAPMPFELARPQPTHYNAKTLYAVDPREPTRYAPMFHGPCFQGVRQILRWGREGIEADMEVADFNRFFANIRQPAFQIEPALLDSAGQLVGYWVAEQFGADLSFFPFRVREYRQFRQPPAAGQRVLCRAVIRIVGGDHGGQEGRFDFLDAAGTVIKSVDESHLDPVTIPDNYFSCRLYPQSAYLEAVFDFLGPDGQVIARLEGWQDRYFSIPHGYYQCRLQPETAYYSLPWAQGETGLACRRIDPAPMPFLDESWGIWKRVLAHLMLCPEERRQWYELTAEPERRTDWLMGRIAAKDAVRQWAHDRFGVQLAPVDVRISTTATGKPIVVCPALADLGPVPEVSISHCEGAVVAVASDAGRPVGIDFERSGNAVRLARVEAALEPRELALLAGAPGLRADHALLLWCAKEAAAKAHGARLDELPGGWQASGYDAARNEITVTHAGESFRVRLVRSESEVIALC